MNNLKQSYTNSGPQFETSFPITSCAQFSFRSVTHMLKFERDAHHSHQSTDVEFEIWHGTRAVRWFNRFYITCIWAPKGGLRSPRSFFRLFFVPIFESIGPRLPVCIIGNGKSSRMGPNNSFWPISFFFCHGISFFFSQLIIVYLGSMAHELPPAQPPLPSHTIRTTNGTRDADICVLSPTTKTATSGPRRVQSQVFMCFLFFSNNYKDYPTATPPATATRTTSNMLWALARTEGSWAIIFHLWRL